MKFDFLFGKGNPWTRSSTLKPTVGRRFCRGEWLFASSFFLTRNNLFMVWSLAGRHKSWGKDTRRHPFLLEQRVWVGFWWPQVTGAQSYESSNLPFFLSGHSVVIISQQSMQNFVLVVALGCRLFVLFLGWNFFFSLGGGVIQHHSFLIRYSLFLNDHSWFTELLILFTCYYLLVCYCVCVTVLPPPPPPHNRTMNHSARAAAKCYLDIRIFTTHCKKL